MASLTSSLDVLEFSPEVLKVDHMPCSVKR